MGGAKGVSGKARHTAEPVGGREHGELGMAFQRFQGDAHAKTAFRFQHTQGWAASRSQSGCIRLPLPFSTEFQAENLKGWNYRNSTAL